MWMRSLLCVGACAAAGCLERPPDIDYDAGPEADSGPPDALSGCAPDTIVCDDEIGVYVDCSSTGTVDLQIACPLGCDEAEEKCVDVDPSNGLAPYLDIAPSGPAVAFSGESTIGGNGIVFNAGVSVEVPHDEVNGITVFTFSSLTIAGTLKVTSDTPIALVVDGDVEITGTLDVSADGWMAGPGGYQSYDEFDTHPCNGGLVGRASPTPGGGGGGGYLPGGTGGASGAGVAGGTGGTVRGNEALEPLEGGCAGGLAEETSSPGGISYGGGGGGAIQIVSRTRIDVTGAGVIDASGGGGGSLFGAYGASPLVGGSGGGGGGMILLEAPQVVLDGQNVVLSTKGGGGSAAGGGAIATAGQDGGTGQYAASGGTNPGSASGGAGGTESFAPSPGQAGATAGADGGGGGGSVGRTRLSTLSGDVNPQNGATIRSRLHTRRIGTRLVP